MATKQQKPDPSLPSASYSYMRPKWDMIESLLGGTSSMRAAAEQYLPMHPAESNEQYNDRLHGTTLYNVTELTVNSLAGRVFREEMKLNKDVPKQIVAIADDIDSCGTDVSSFCQSWFKEAVAKGYAHCLIDMPSLSDAEKEIRTLLDDIKENRRPHWTLIKPEFCIAMHYERVDGQKVLLQARLLEYETALGADGFTEVVTTQIRVLQPGAFSIWRDMNENQPGGNKKPEWREVDHGTYDLDQIPLVTFYTDRKGDMLAKPPMEDLAYMNVRHWQSTSDQINVLTVARFPMLAASGTQIEKGKPGLTIGPRQLMSMRDPNGRFYYVEHKGTSIAAGKADLEDLEERMAAYGAEFLRKKITGRTAFERAQDTNEAISPLKDMALRFQQTVALALDITADWFGLEGGTDKVNAGGTVTINTKFTEDDTNDSAMKTLGDARKRGDISRKTFITEMIRRGVVDQTLNPEEEIKLILEEFKQGPFPPTFFQGLEQVKLGAMPGAGGDAGGDLTVDHTGTPVKKAPPKKKPAE
jgi:hypothetical protein